METESRIVVLRDWEESNCLMGTEFLFAVMFWN